MVGKTKPKVSVIIPFSKPNLIEGALESVLNQDYPRDRLEVIVVGKGSRKLMKRWPIRAVDRGPIHEPGRARNLGAKKASGEIFLFLDDDCRALPGWLKENLKELKNKKVGAVGGMVMGRSQKYFALCYDFTAFSRYQIKKRQKIHVPAATMGVRREVFGKLGGFDPTLRKVEDGDFCFRLIKEGYQAIYQPRVKVIHDHQRETFKDFLTYTYTSGKWAGLVLETRYTDLSWRFKFFSLINYPAAYPLALGPIALMATLVMVGVNVLEHPKVLSLSPVMFLGQLFYHFGVWQWILKEKRR